jgi:hypothetical protein
MPAKKPLPRTGLSPEERRLRSRITQLVSSQPLLRGTLVDRRRRCGNPGCRCASDPALGHPGLYVFLSAGRGKRQQYVPAPFHASVRQWVANYQELRQLLWELSELYWQKLQRREL